jgi:hypothetical protein
MPVSPPSDTLPSRPRLAQRRPAISPACKRLLALGFIPITRVSDAARHYIHSKAAAAECALPNGVDVPTSEVGGLQQRRSVCSIPIWSYHF